MVLDLGIKSNINPEFVQEALGLLQQIHNGLLELPNNYSPGKMRTLVRVAQLIKDVSAQVDLADIQNLAYRLEKIFRLLSLENQIIDANITALLIEANENLGLLLIAQIQGKTDDAVNLLAKTDSVFANLETRNYQQPIAINSLAKLNVEPGLSHLIDTAEVTQALNNLEMILAQSEADNLVEKLKLAANIFLSFGDRLKITEFVAIAQIAIACLENSPKAAPTIGRIALAGWRTAYEEISKPVISSNGKSINSAIAIVKPNSDRPNQPRTLKTSQLFVWTASGNIFTINSNSVKEILVAQADQLIYSQQQWFLHWQGKIIPTYGVSQLLNAENLPPEKTQPEPIFIISLGQQIIALQPQIESLIAELELPIQPVPASVKLPSYVYGLTTWKDKPLQVIDLAALLSETIAQNPDISANPNLFNPADTATANRESTVLIVDDSNSVRHLISMTLQKVGYKILHAQDGQEAIAQLQQNSQVELVICDVEMPKMNGFEFLSYRLKEQFLSTIPVVMLSSCTTNNHRLLAMQLGATTYFTKPYIEQEFLAAIKLIIEHKG
ncbi:response regulator [Calothrix sp. FACHB-1219]|uniref:response regulator n=1 Tax=unclassified Calothrix TaxID=2619626 RepID=UPI0016829974|nr:MULTISPECIES: response regulator [unclassified Calothrix]MBD2207111.1 response regulator [Calothrix sp. FACHB-168]MBD2221768.1 response regulator [Calothrix sp. FACHB-1219]